MLRTAFAILLCTAAATSHSATIYLCKSYGGARFWSSVTCGEKNALIERIDQVADVPWNQQVQQAEQQNNNRPAHAATNTTGNDQRCGQLINERRQIESRYNNWQWQPPEVINPDQQRTRAINAELHQRGCRLQ